VSDQYILRLFVAGSSPRAKQALDNLQRLCDEELHGRYQVEVIDVLERPDLAEADRVLATPTLIKRLPPPLRRVIGDLSDKEKVLLGLELRAQAHPSPHKDESR
jgi:circadian clock protein KaiB